MEWRAWFDQNWFQLAQTLSILGSVWLTRAAVRREARARKLTEYLALAGHHRELWSEIHRHPTLARVVQAEADLLANPLSAAEAEFLNLAIVHFQSGWLVAKDGGGLLSLDVLTADVQAFFCLPLPRLVWEQTRHMRDPKFVGFIEHALKKQPSNPE